jgi:hypothetical protein
MQRIATLLTIALLSGGVAAPANADWQYTKWGMTPAEVVAASDGKAVPDEKPSTNIRGEVSKLKAPHAAGDYEFLATFSFDKSDKLATVLLFLKGPTKCDLLRDEVISKYGSPQRSATSSLIRELSWLVVEENTKIMLSNLGSGTLCTLEYSALSGESRKGL